MPQMGESIAEGTLSKWLKNDGDEVKRDEPIFEISTDKVDAEIPSPSNGVLAEVLVKEGQTVPVQTVVARLETEKGAAISGAGATAPAASAPAQKPAPAPTLTAGASSAGSRPAPPAGGPPALQNKVAVPVAAHPSAAPRTSPPQANGGNSLQDRLRTKSSPLVRKIAAEHGIELSAMQGSGVAGRVTKRAFFEIDRTRIARVRAKARAEFEAKTGQKLTFLPFIIKVVVDGLKQHPVLNAAVAGTSIIYRKQYNIGIAVALDWGLIVPVIKNADDLSITGLTRQLNDLAQRARSKRLQPQEVQGATFSITNPGVFGSLMGTPIIPLNTSAILGLGAIEKRPKVIAGPDGEDTIAIRTCAYFSLSFDHRIVAGAAADHFLAALK